MNIESLKLRKFTIVNIPTGTMAFFTARDLYDNSEQTIHLGASQRIHFTTFKIDDIIYAYNGRENKWWLISPAQFKTKLELLKLRFQLDEYFGD